MKILNIHLFRSRPKYYFGISGLKNRLRLTHSPGSPSPAESKGAPETEGRQALLPSRATRSGSRLSSGSSPATLALGLTHALRCEGWGSCRLPLAPARGGSVTFSKRKSAPVSLGHSLPTEVQACSRGPARSGHNRGQGDSQECHSPSGRGASQRVLTAGPCSSPRCLGSAQKPHTQRNRSLAA